MTTKEKFWNWVMGIKRKHVVWACVVVFLIIALPFPAGAIFLNWKGSYQLNIKGIFWTNYPFTYWFPLWDNCHVGYLEDASIWSFRVLDDEWAKDKNHVWHMYYPVKDVDAATFELGPNGIPKDKYHVFVSDLWDYYPSQCDIDPATAEYFVQLPISFDYFTGEAKLSWVEKWMRDRRHVYFYERRVDVDRATFRWLAGHSWCSPGEWYVDKDFVYTVRRVEGYNPPFELVRVDSLREPLEIIPYFVDGIDARDTIYHPSCYLRNGSNILYKDSVAVRDIDVKSLRVEYIGGVYSQYDCIINDTLRLQNGKREDE